MQVETTSLPGVKLLTPICHEDDRGWFSETWNLQVMAGLGLDYAFVQDNHSFSKQVHTLRGLHYQAPPHAQAKLVRCLRGAVYDVAVDIRRGSPTFGQWAGAHLSAVNRAQLMIPQGFLHGFVTLEPDTEVAYKCTGFYNGPSDGSVLWDSCGITWPFSGPPALSGKDRAAPPLADFDSPFIWEG